QQLAGVGMARPRIQAVRGCELHHAPEIQHQYALAQLPHQRQIVTDEQQAHVRLALQVREQGHDLLLGRDIQRTDRLVADEQTGLQDRGAGDADTLALAARELVRVAARELGGGAHAAEHRGEAPRAPGRRGGGAARTRADLPQPDSPTTPSASPAYSSRLTALTAVSRACGPNQPRPTSKRTVRSVSLRAAGDPGGAAAAPGGAPSASRRGASRTRVRV